jgi:hypothetical protein
VLARTFASRWRDSALALFGGVSMSDETARRNNIEPAGGRSASSYEKGTDAGLLLPMQYADLVRRNHVIEGELKLLLAVLEDAIRCYLRNVHAKDGEHRRDFVEVRNWFEGGGRHNARRPDIFSFDNLCAALGIEPRCLLERLHILTLGDLPSRRYQMRRHRPLSSLRHANGIR